MIKPQEDISVTVIASNDDDKDTIEKKLKELEASTCRFSVAIIVLKSNDTADWINKKMSIKSIDKAVIVYERPVNIELAKTVRDKLVEAGVSEIKDCFYDKQNLSEIVNNSVANFIGRWNEYPKKENKKKLEIGQYITPSNAKKDDPIKLYASAMIGKMGELLLKLNKLANDFAVSMSEYFPPKDTANEQTPKQSSTLSNLFPPKKQKQKNNEVPKPAEINNITELKRQIKNALAEKNGNVWQPSEGSPHLPKILLIGDSGVGKSLVANYIHGIVMNKLGKALDIETRNRPARIGIPEFEKKEDDLEYSLFGYASEAFTGASKDGYLGLLLDNICQVVFLDEIGAATSAIQNKLLTYLDDYKVRPRGMNADIFCPTLIVAATNERDRLNNPKEFRSDLLARFTDRLIIPNIEDRINGDEKNLLYLLDCILQDEHINPEIKELKVTSIGEKAFKALFDHFNNGCAGNFRELENLMREACEQARKDKRDYMVQQDVLQAMKALNMPLSKDTSGDYMVQQDVLQAIDNLNLTLTTSQEESKQASASTENAASSQPAPKTEIEQSPDKTEETDDLKKEITDKDKDDYLKQCHIAKNHKDFREQVLEKILADYTLGYSRIIKELYLPKEDITKSLQSAVQRLDQDIRKYFKLPSCREARKNKKQKSINH